MMALRTLLARVLGLVNRGRTDAALDDDIRAHLDLLTREYIDRGLSPRDAEAAARRAFGGVEQMKERYRDQRGIPAVEKFLQDLRYAARMLRRDPAFAAVAIASLAIGIGASTAAFSVFNAVMLRPLPVSDPDRLVLLQPQRRGDRFILFNPIYEELRARQTTLSGLFAANDAPQLKVTFDEEPVYVRASLVSGNYFEVLGLEPEMGRLLTNQDDELPAASADDRCAAVISHRLWTRRFEQSTTALGRTFRVGDRTCAIVGIAPALFESHQTGFAADVWLPLRQLTDRKLLASRGMAFFSGVMGRLAPAVTVAQAEAELTTLYQQAHAAEPQPPASAQARTTPTDFAIRLAPGAQGFDAIRRSFSAPLAIILAVVGAVLLIASLNVANLLLARGAARLPELATRAALGASRWRLARQLATEAFLLTALGGIVGVGLAWLTIPFLASQISLGYTTIRLDAHPDARVLGFAVILAFTAALVAGVFPAVRLSRTSLQAGLASGSRTTIASGRRLQQILVTAQLATSLLLVSATGLLLRTLVHIAGVDPGFSPAHVVMLNVRDEAPRPSFGEVDDAAAKLRRAERYRLLDERFNTLPGVQAASVSWLGLFSTQDLWLGLIDPDRTDEARKDARVDYVSTRYFETMGMQILRGRGFQATDREGTPRVAVINETLARARFGAGDPLGRRVAIDYRGEEQRPFTIVGVVRDSKYNDLRDSRPNPMMWMAIAQVPFPISSVSLRTAPGMEVSIARQAEAALRATDPDIMVRRTTTLSAQVAGTTSRERLLLGLSSGVATLATLLAAVGLYGTLAYMVNRRRREIGVRLAFGARRDDILRMVVGDALRLLAVALIVGAPLSIAAGYSLRSFLFGVTPADHVTLVGACLVLTTATLIAAFVPARRAAAVDAIGALRCD
jgi:predicted permease